MFKSSGGLLKLALPAIFPIISSPPPFPTFPSFSLSSHFSFLAFHVPTSSLSLPRSPTIPGHYSPVYFSLLLLRYHHPHLFISLSPHIFHSHSTYTFPSHSSPSSTHTFHYTLPTSLSGPLFFLHLFAHPILFHHLLLLLLLIPIFIFFSFSTSILTKSFF